MKKFDAIIIGTGQAGFPLARALAEKGWKVAVVERSHVGGTCINYGCTPTKTMWASARRAYVAKNSLAWGVETTGFKVNLKNKSVLVEGLNLYKKHGRPKRQGEKGEILTLPRPLEVSRVMLYCLNCKRGVRIGHRIEGAKKVRYCKRCQISL